MIHRQVGYAVRRAVRSIIAAPVLQLVAVSTIALALLVFCVVVTLGLNLDRMASQWADEMGVVAFLDADHTPEALAALQTEVSSWREVSTVRIHSRADALADLKQALGDDAILLEGVDPTVLPASLEVILVPTHQSDASTEAVSERLRALSGFTEISRIDSGKDLLGRLSEVRDLLHLGGLVVGILVLLAVVFIISNTIRLTLYARRAELEVMRLVGAAEWFVRVPCYLEGALQGAAGAMVALLGCWTLVITLPSWSPLHGDGLSGGQLAFLSWWHMTTLVIGAALMGVVASHLAAGRFGHKGGVGD